MAVSLLRHTTPNIASGVCYGRSDVDLAPSFATECETVLQSLPRFDVLISSPLFRCSELAIRIGAHTGTSPLIDPDWTEMDFGAWEGNHWDQIPRDQIDDWANDFETARPHGGENVRMVTARISRALTNLPDCNVLVVTHQGAIRTALHLNGADDPWNNRTPYGGVVTLPD